MVLTLRSFLIVCPMLFLAGFIDSIGGGGGLISLPAYLFAGLPVHAAVATNKLSSSCGSTMATLRFIKNRLISFRLVLPGILTALVGSAVGARLSLLASEALIRALLLPVLPAAAFVVLNPRFFPDGGQDRPVTDRRTVLCCAAASLLIGAYDGFYGPGTGTFLIIAFSVFARLSTKAANAQAKAINLASNLSSLAIFLRGGQVVITLGLAAAACNMLGNYLGSGLVLSRGSRVVRPVILCVLALLLIKLLTELL